MTGKFKTEEVCKMKNDATNIEKKPDAHDVILEMLREKFFQVNKDNIGNVNYACCMSEIRSLLNVLEKMRISQKDQAGVVDALRQIKARGLKNAIGEVLSEDLFLKIAPLAGKSDT